MIEARPSRTAFRVALARAAHQLLDVPKVFDDPVALEIVGAEAAAKMKLGLDDLNDRIPGPVRAFFAVRSRYAEDQLKEAVTSGVTQCVILGAGLDTFAYRHGQHSSLRIFEADHTTTQAWKKDLLRAANISIPPSLTFVAMNFEHDKLVEGLKSSGFRSDRAAVFSWLGVVPYLTHDAMTITLQFIAARPEGSRVVFDYAVPRESLDGINRHFSDVLSKRVAGLGEPFSTVLHSGTDEE